MPGEDTRRGVRRTYDAIADHFAETRHHPWPEVQDFLADAPPIDRALDLGCGNGRHTELLAERAEEVLAVDASHGMLETARDRLDSNAGVHLLQGDATRLPLKSDTVDCAVFVATIHHLPTREQRLASLRELGRALRANARALVSTWSTAHDRFDAAADDETGFDTTIDWTLPDGDAVDRFHHIYSPAEFRADIDAAGLVLSDFEVSSGNCYAVVAPEGKRP